MNTHTVTVAVDGSFRPVISASAVQTLRAAALRWIAAGKPDYIPTEDNRKDDKIEKNRIQLRP